jgi:hypothetical protein
LDDERFARSWSIERDLLKQNQTADAGNFGVFPSFMMTCMPLFKSFLEQPVELPSEHLLAQIEQTLIYCHNPRVLLLLSASLLQMPPLGVNCTTKSMS